MNKKFLKITGIMALSMTLLGFWGYNQFFKPDPEVEQQLNNQFGEDFFSFEDEGMVSNQAKANIADSVNNKESVSNIQPGNEEVNAQGKDRIGTTSAHEDIDANTVKQDEISNKYKTQFDHLQSAGLSRLDTLYSAAVQEYKQSKKDGTLSRSELIQKYLQAGTTLEANMDSQIYGSLNMMEAELKANNLPADSISVYKAEYEKAKSDKRAQMLAKVR